MPTITYIEHNGTEHTCDVPSGRSVMEGAREHGVPGILAECGGAAACATCRIFVGEAWITKIAAAEPLERSMLDELEEVDPHQRLSCQIVCTEDLDGLIVRLPANQY